MAKKRTSKSRHNRKSKSRLRDENIKAAGNKKGDKKKGPIREWAEALVFAFVVMVIIRTFLFDLFQIPTPSMEKSLLVGDYLFVSKLHYGTRTPVSIGVPFTDWHIHGLTLPHTRFPGFSELKRNDAVVFNWPGDEEWKAIDRKEHYIKRLIGLPGDTLQIINKIVHINGVPMPVLATQQQQWVVSKEDARVQLSETVMHSIGLECVTCQERRILSSQGRRLPPSLQEIVNGTAGAVDQLRQRPGISDIQPYIVSQPDVRQKLYPPDKNFTIHNFGPVVLPKKGVTISLSADNWLTYEPVIRKYEYHTTKKRADGQFEIDGQLATKFTFSQDYFFMMGDNRDNSLDSRFWGFVPKEYIVGKAVLIYLSLDGWMPRFSRIFSWVK